MPRRILIAPDKFKGSLSALQAADAIARGIRSREPDAELDLCPIADGGEGFMKSMASALSGDWIECPAVDALGTPIDSRYYLADTSNGPTAVIEMAETAGMWRLSPASLAPLRATTRGVGMQIAHAIRVHQVGKIYLGLGGSATNDAGCGMAEALGLRFLDTTETAFAPTPERLPGLSHLDRTRALHLPPILAACDVSNPLLGETGATHVFGPQKGAEPSDLATLEEALSHLVSVTSSNAHASTPGAGAAGGLGFGLLHFTGALLVPGFDLLADLLNLDTRIESADWIITGEGSLDSQSMGGKGPVGMARRAMKLGKPVAAFCGAVDEAVLDSKLFAQIHALTDTGLPLDSLMQQAADLLERLAKEASLP